MNKKKLQRESTRQEYIPSTLRDLLSEFASCFTAPSFSNFVTLVSGWLICQGRHSISRVIQAGGGESSTKHFSTLYRFLSRGKWSSDDLSKILFRLLLPWLTIKIEAFVDDTLCHRSGPRIFGGGMHHDASRSTYGKKTSSGTIPVFSFGQNWVILAVRLPLPWDRDRGMAIPILFRLYRSKRYCPEVQYRKRTELALELVKLLESWIPAGYQLSLSGDGEYACKTLVPNLKNTTTFLGPMAKNAALYKPANPYSGFGRPRKRGARLCSPSELAAKKSIRWKTIIIQAYRHKVKIKIKTMSCLWYTVAGTREIRMVITRDPKGRIEERAFFSTDPNLTVREILQRISHRWLIEVSFRDAKQHLGLEDPQNGWGRGKKRGRKLPGPQARGDRGAVATLHTLPLAFTAYAIVVLWYLQHGDQAGDVKRACLRMPWFRGKVNPSYGDMLIALRRETWAGRLSEDPGNQRQRRKFMTRICDALLAA